MIPICTCKAVANLDEIIIREGGKPSLSPYSLCYGCSGTNLNCRNYSNPNINDAAKKRLLFELVYGTGREVLFGGDGR